MMNDKGVRGHGPSSAGRCEEILDLLSVRLARGGSGRDELRVERHLDGCRACAEEFRFMRRVFVARPAPPAGLTESILARLDVRPLSRTAHWWSASLSAAAVLVLAMGVGLATQAMESRTASGGWELAGTEEFDSIGEDWFVAGAPYLDAVSDETLLALLSEVDF